MRKLSSIHDWTLAEGLCFPALRSTRNTRGNPDACEVANQHNLTMPPREPPQDDLWPGMSQRLADADARMTALSTPTTLSENLLKDDHLNRQSRRALLGARLSSSREFFDEGDIANCTFALQKANELHGQPKWNHWAELEAVQAMILSSKVLSLAKDILGETPVFFGRVLETFEAEPLRQHHPVGHSSFQGLTKSVPRFLHIDAKGTEERLFTKRTGILEDRYPVIRFSHYFQDHSRYSYGIKLAPGSHRDGNPQNVQSLQESTCQAL